ncbi:MAG: peptide MFS transporter [Gemmatimonadota bacterium]
MHAHRPTHSMAITDDDWQGPAATTAEPALGAADRSFFGHPKGLSVLFFTEMWERFSYYGMRGILILFMTASVANGGMGFDTAKAGAVYGLYVSFVYLLALPGGWVADRVVGQRNAVFIGGVVIALGHFSMAVPTAAMFYLGLVLIIFGTGLLKPNISTMVGELYPGDAGARRDAGFSIFYMGINLGAFLAPLVVGYLGEKIDWHLGFGAAGVGMVAGLIWYKVGGRYLGDAGHFDGDVAEARARGKNLLFALVGLGAVLVAGLYMQSSGTINVTAARLASLGGVVIAGLALAYFAYVLIMGGLDLVEKKRVVAIFFLFAASALFWSGFEQAGSTLNLVADRITDRFMFGWEIPASWFQSINALFIITLAPVFAWLWVALARKNLEPSSPLKFAFGLLLVGAGFAAMMLATLAIATGDQISPAWLVLTYFLHTTGELALSPVGLSTVTKLAPHRMVGQMMGVWFMSISLGNLIAGQVAGLYESMELSTLFGTVATVSAAGGVLLLLFVGPIRKLMGGVH